jgi:hypothetical protein
MAQQLGNIADYSDGNIRDMGRTGLIDAAYPAGSLAIRVRDPDHLHVVTVWSVVVFLHRAPTQFPLGPLVFTMRYSADRCIPHPSRGPGSQYGSHYDEPCLPAVLPMVF